MIKINIIKRGKVYYEKKLQEINKDIAAYKKAIEGEDKEVIELIELIIEEGEKYKKYYSQHIDIAEQMIDKITDIEVPF